MDIVVEQIPDTELPAQPELEREVTTAPDEPDKPASSPKRRGRPPGVKNKPKLIEPSEPVFVEPEPVFAEPEVEEEELPPPKPKKARATKPKQAPLPWATEQQPQIQTPLQVAASMLEIL